jgi:chromosome segregation ATPase
MLESTITQLHREREVYQSEQSEKNLGGIIGGIQNLSQLEAMLAFKEKELEEYRVKMEQQVHDYKRQKDQLKGELEVQKEMTLNYQQAVIERDRYKQAGEETVKLKQRLAEAEQANQKKAIEIKNIEHELNEASTYKKAYDYMSNEIVKVKGDCQFQLLENQKMESKLAELDIKYKRIEQKYEALKIKDRSNKDLIETLSTKLRVYENFKTEMGDGNGLGELDELEK